MAKVIKRNGAYLIDYTVGGRRVKKVIGPKKAEADAELAKITLEIREGTFHHRSAKSTTLADALTRYLKLCPADPDKQRYLATFAADFKGRKLADIRKEQMVEWLQTRRETPIVYERKVGEDTVRHEKPRSPATCNRELAAVRHFFNKSIEWGYLYVSPCAGIKPLKEPKGRVRYLTVEEAAALIDKADKRIRPIIVMCLETGMRKTEVLTTKWDNVDMAARSIFIPTTKNGESRNVPMSERLAEILDDIPRMDSSPYVFHHLKGKRAGTRYLDVDGAFTAACGKAGIKEFRFHDLRHTAASHMAMAGVPIAVVGAVLGHKTLAMTQRYSHLSPSSMKDAVNALPVWKILDTRNNPVTNEVFSK